MITFNVNKAKTNITGLTGYHITGVKLFNNYSPKWFGKYPLLTTSSSVNSCFSID